MFKRPDLYGFLSVCLPLSMLCFHAAIYQIKYLTKKRNGNYNEINTNWKGNE